MIDYSDLTTEEKEFKAAVEAAGLPTSKDDIKAEFKTIVEASGFTITNTSNYSPFWTTVTNLMTTPVYWMIAFLVRFVMPNAYAKTAAGTFLDLIAYAYDLKRKEASKAKMVLTFTRESLGQPAQIDEGVTVRTVTINDTIYRAVTTETVEFGPSDYSVDVSAEAEDAGEAYNLGTGYYSTLEDYIAGVSVANGEDYLTAPGADEETDDELRARIRNQFTAVSEWHTDAKYKSMIAHFAGISVDYIYFDHNIPRGAGSADAYILFDVYAPIGDYIDSINEYINDNGNHGHGDDMLVKEMPEISVDVALNIVYAKNLSDDEKAGLEEQVKLFIGGAFRDNSDYDDFVTKTWPNSRFSFSQLDCELHEYFDDIVSVMWLQDDIVTDGLEIARLGTLTITEVTE